MATINFDAADVPPAGAPLPPGKYLACIVKSELKANKSGTGEYLELKYQILEGPVNIKGRQIFSRHNIIHPNNQCQEIARGELSAICRAVGVMAPKDSAELHNLPLTITVRPKTRQDTGEETSEVKGWAAKSSGATAPATPAAAPWKKSG